MTNITYHDKINLSQKTSKMRLIIIPIDKFVSIDNEGIHGVDMTWIPEFTGESGISTSVHAVQWYGDHGEIELNSRDNNLVITELGVLEEVITKYEERKLEIVEIAEQKRLEQIELDHDSLLDIDDILKELESEENVNVGVATT